MRPRAQPIRKTDLVSTADFDKVSLRVVETRDLSEWPTAPGGNQSAPHCLLYLVALDGPRIRSNQARRLRLKDSLAGGVASQNAAILSRDAHFWDYLQQINLTAYEAEIDERRARHFINRVCGISSRYQLDRQDNAARRFFTLIEQPFLEWLLATACE